MIRIFNIFAELCSVILKSCSDESLYAKYSCISEDLKKKIIYDIYNNISFLFDTDPGSIEHPFEKHIIHCLRTEDLDDRFYSELEIYIQSIINRSDYFGMIGLLQVLDEALALILLDKIHEFQTDSFSVVLNTNRELTGIGLLPRCSCVWERKHKLSYSYNRLDNFLYNILMVESSILGDIVDIHIFLKRELFPEFSEKKQLIIAASPLRAEPHYIINVYKRDNIQYCNISSDPDTFERDNNDIMEMITKASQKNCDIIVFPEMLGNPQTADYISAKIKALSVKDQKKIPSLIILPSLWKDNMNVVTVIDNAGNIVCRQSKQYPYRYERDGLFYLEDIKSNKVVNILHFEGIGRIAILICKDFLTTRYMEQIMRCFKLTLIIVPSNSTGSYDFCQSFDLCAHDDCNVIWINTCAALKKGKEENFKNIGYVRKRIGRNDDASQKLCEMPICSGAFEDNCSHDCLYFETIQGV